MLEQFAVLGLRPDLYPGIHGPARQFFQQMQRKFVGVGIGYRIKIEAFFCSREPHLAQQLPGRFRQAQGYALFCRKPQAFGIGSAFNQLADHGQRQTGKVAPYEGFSV
ncbi:hypothetical protein D3C80_501950 [compost metagenome]